MGLIGDCTFDKSADDFALKSTQGVIDVSLKLAQPLSDVASIFRNSWVYYALRNTKMRMIYDSEQTIENFLPEMRKYGYKRYSKSQVTLTLPENINQKQ
jgi:hypothetical protein